MIIHPTDMRIHIDTLIHNDTRTARHHFTPTVANRIRRLNGPLVQPGQRLRGYHPHKRSVPPFAGLVSVRWFVEKHGRAALEAMPKEEIVRDGHRRAIRQEAVEDNLWIPNMRKP